LAVNLRERLVQMLAPVCLINEVDRAENNITRTLESGPDYKVTGPLVSVITIAYNEENYLPLQIQALKNQTYNDIEYIVVDNKSTDGTVQIAQDAGATVVVNPDYNLSKSRNMGAAVAAGDILIFMDADSFPEQTGIEMVVREITDKGNVMAHLNHCCYDSNMHSIIEVAKGYTLGRHCMTGQFIAVMREVFDAVGGFDESLLPQKGQSEDVDFIFKVISRYPGKTALLKNIYSGTSARRYKAEGYVVFQHFQNRAIR
jgi:glycosyltransferase involved in cell wall biosynthesis